MTIVNVGLSHRFAPAEMLEKLAVPPAELGDVLTRLRTVPSVDEVVVLSTCNRVEIYAAASGPAEQVTQAVAGLMASRGAVPDRRGPADGPHPSRRRGRQSFVLGRVRAGFDGRR
jgi:glutamyl-tRNA reductase